MIEWTDARVSLALRRRAEGRSASEIAVELGEGVTRSAVLAKFGRLKQPAPFVEKRSAVLKLRAARAKWKAANVSCAPQIALPAPVPQPEPITDERSPVAFSRVRDGQCRFSIDLCAPPSADMLVCGAATPVGRSWCRACASRVFSRLDPRATRNRSMTP